MNWRVRYTRAARADVRRLYGFLLAQGVAAAERAMVAIDKSVKLLQLFPFTCRKADPDNPLLRELLVSFGTSGYVVLYDIGDDQTVTILAIRRQREDDYH